MQLVNPCINYTQITGHHTQTLYHTTTSRVHIITLCFCVIYRIWCLLQDSDFIVGQEDLSENSASESGFLAFIWLVGCLY